MKRTWLADISLLLVALIWGSTFIIVQAAVQTLPPLAFNAIRFLGAAALFFVVMACSPKRLSVRFSKALMKDGIKLGIWLFGGYAFQTIGLLYTTTTNTGFITGLSVVLVPFLMVLLAKERLQGQTWIAALLALLGLYLLTFNGKGFHWNLGDVLVLLCAVCFAMHIALTGRYAKLHDTVALVTMQFAVVGVLALFSSLLLEPIMLPAELFAAMLAPKVWFALLVSIGLSTGFGFWAQTWSQQYTSPARVAIIFAMEPVFAAITGVAFANEKLGQLALWGSMCIFLSMIIAEWKWRPREVH